jgi:hypothetical protein
MLTSQAAAAEEPICKVIDRNWHWFSDHFAMSVDYTSLGAAGRIYEVGTGISVNGSPWGSREKYSELAEFTAYGVGAVHIRQADTGEPFRVCAMATKINAVTILKQQF